VGVGVWSSGLGSDLLKEITNLLQMGRLSADSGADSPYRGRLRDFSQHTSREVLQRLEVSDYWWMACRSAGKVCPTIRVQEMLSAHERNFKMPLPSTVVLDVKKERLRGQLSIKIIALMKQHLEDLAQKIGAGVGVSDREHGAVALDRATRYVTTSVREMERALKWYLDLKEQHM